MKDRFYKRRRPVRRALIILAVVILLCALLFVILFFALQRYIIHTPDGVRLDIPALRSMLPPIPEVVE